MASCRPEELQMSLRCPYLVCVPLCFFICLIYLVCYICIYTESSLGNGASPSTKTKT